MRLRTEVPLLTIFVLTTACLPGPEVGYELDGEETGLPSTPDGVTTPGVVGFAELQEKIFTPSCATSLCHEGKATDKSPMSLAAGAAYASLVGKASSQAPSTRRVDPGNAAGSYLMLKLRGQAASVGGTPSRMPLNKPALPAERIAEIEAWIERGAPND